MKSVKANPKALHVEVIFSRRDYITRDRKSSEQEKFLERIETDLTTKFGTVFADMKFWRVAARPVAGKRTDREIEDIFGHWLQPVRWKNAPPSRNQQPARDFCGYGLV